MKLLGVFLAFAAISAAAQLHRHSHQHAHRDLKKREPSDAAVYAPGPVATVVVYELNGHTITEDEVRQGIANGTLSWDEDGNLSSSVAPAVAEATPPPKEATEPGIQPQPNQDINQNEPPAQQPPSPAPSSAPLPQSQQSPQSLPDSYQPTDGNGQCPDCDKVFPDNELPCGKFPSGYGAVHLPNEGLGGWTGVQDPVYRAADGMDNIWTAPKDSCTNGACCSPGRFCSYGCPNPYLKQSFPKSQGKTGQSIGGLYCNPGGKLEMADGSIGNTLCGKGTNKFTVKVQNKLAKSVSICRTDYPGTESETIPLTVGPGMTGELANPALSKYYFWQGNPTSAQYYINKQGVPESEACTWGTGAKAVGNWAPVVFGTSWDDIKMNLGYSSLFQNSPTTNERLDFTITFTGDGITNPCSYKSSTGEYCNDGNNCSQNNGCTASATEGSTLTMVFTDN